MMNSGSVRRDLSYPLHQPRTQWKSSAMHGGGLELAVFFLLAAVAAVPLFRRLGLGAVLGYLMAGVTLGPDGLGIVTDAQPVLAASEIGVVMLLFVIGLELSPARLRVMRKPVFVMGCRWCPPGPCLPWSPPTVWGWAGVRRSSLALDLHCLPLRWACSRWLSASP